MNRVDQTVFGFPGGNCFSACVASILEMDLAEVPYFMGDEPDEADDKWFARLDEWLKPHGFYAMCLRADSEWKPKGLNILSGKSPRGVKDDDMHSVVADGTELVHDPHPTRDGLLSHHDVVVLVSIDPAEARRKHDQTLDKLDDLITLAEETTRDHSYNPSALIEAWAERDEYR
jgi:hypothetical protein